MTFLAPWKDASDAGFQITQSFLGLRQRRSVWSGIGRRQTEAVFLPEAHTDFVLALVGEELGSVGTATVILLFAFFVWRGFQIAARARMPFGRYLGMGITLLIGVQALVNAAVVTGLLPTKGLTLPFVSYGGSSLVVSLVGVGILLSISRDRHGGESRRRTRWVGSRMTIVIAAGGTGGHLYPAVALAREFLRRDPQDQSPLRRDGTRTRVEGAGDHEGFDLALISAKPVMGKGLFEAC